MTKKAETIEKLLNDYLDNDFTVDGYDKFVKSVAKLNPTYDELYEVLMDEADTVWEQIN